MRCRKTVTPLHIGRNQDIFSPIVRFGPPTSTMYISKRRLSHYRSLCATGSLEPSSPQACLTRGCYIEATSNGKANSHVDLKVGDIRTSYIVPLLTFVYIKIEFGACAYKPGSRPSVNSVYKSGQTLLGLFGITEYQYHCLIDCSQVKVTAAALWSGPSTKSKAGDRNLHRQRTMQPKYKCTCTSPTEGSFGRTGNIRRSDTRTIPFSNVGRANTRLRQAGISSPERCILKGKVHRDSQ